MSSVFITVVVIMKFITYFEIISIQILSYLAFR